MTLPLAFTPIRAPTAHRWAARKVCWHRDVWCPTWGCAVGFKGKVHGWSLGLGTNDIPVGEDHREWPERLQAMRGYTGRVQCSSFE